MDDNSSNESKISFGEDLMIINRMPYEQYLRDLNEEDEDANMTRVEEKPREPKI